MSPTDGNKRTRRTVLRTAGTGVAALAGVGVATASSFEVGDCVVTNQETDVFDDSACNTGGNVIDIVPTGVDGHVESKCTSNYGVDFVFVDWGGDPYQNGWVEPINLDHC